MVVRLHRDQRGELAHPATVRRDLWWLEPIPVIILLGGFGVYSFWAALQNAHYYVAPYLSPFYSPCLASNCQHLSLPVIGSWWKWSPAFLILGFPLAFRATCYYYRKAYYRAFFWLPPACAVPDRAASYSGETRFPYLLQNLHRYFFWLVIPVLAFLWIDAFHAFRFPTGFGIGIGSLVLLLNAALLSLYSLSCHSCRHLCGGRFDTLTRHPIRHRLWQLVSSLNERHGQIAWVSLVWVGLTDLYVRLLSMGILSDLRLF